MRSQIGHIQFYCFLALIFWLPIPLGSNRPWAWSILEITSLMLLASVFIKALVFNIPIKSKITPYKSLIAAFTLIQLWILIQTFALSKDILFALSPALETLFANVPSTANTLSLDVSETLVESLLGWSYWAVMLLTILLVNSEKRLKQTLLVIVLAGTFQAVYGSLMALSGSPTSWLLSLENSHIATGSFVYKNHFANFLLLCLSMGIGLMVAGLSRGQQQSKKAQLRQLISSLMKGKATLRIALALMVIALVLSKSRMGNAAFFISMTATGILAFFYFKDRSKSLTFLLASLLVIDTFILGAWFGIEKVQERLTQTSFTQETRDEVVIDSLELIKQYPLTGTGAGSFYTVFPSVKGTNVTLFYDHAHNDYIQFTVEYGVPATLILAAIVMSALWQSFYAMRHRRHPLMKGTAFGCMMAIIGMLIHISVDFNLQAPANAAYFTLILTLAWQSRYLLGKQKPIK